MTAYLEQVDDVSELLEAVQSLVGTDSFTAAQFHDDVAGEHKRYAVYKIVSCGKAYILKKYDRASRLEAEKAIYDLLPESAPVPHCYGAHGDCLLMEYIDGEDLLHASDVGIAAAAKSVAEIMNAFPFNRTYDRALCEKEIAYWEKRLESLAGEPLLKEAFTLFLARLKAMPLTLGHCDLVPINCLFNGERAYLINWEYGGFVPYALDLGRFLAHSGTKETSVYRMTAEQKQLFVDTVYAELIQKPDRAVYDLDVRFAIFDELTMVLQFYLKDPTQERDASYRQYCERANLLAKELIGNQAKSTAV